MGDEVQLTGVRIYETNGNASIRLSVAIGNMNVGGTSVFWNNEFISEGEVDNLLIEDLINGLSNRLLKCFTKIKDINPATNTTVVTYKLSGGKAEEEFQFEIDVKQEGGFAIYAVTFILL